MSTELEIDHEYTDEIVCPHCGDKTEWEPENHEVFEENCPSCDKEYRVVVHHSVVFSTETFDRAAEEREEVEKKAKEDAVTAVVYAACQKFPPGTRVRIVAMNGWRNNHFGELGTVANKELSKRHPSVRVNLDRDAGRSLEYPDSYFPEQIEAE